MIIIVNNDCDYCYECTEACSSGVLNEEWFNRNIKPGYELECVKVFEDDCTYCESCVMCCPNEAISVLNPTI